VLSAPMETVDDYADDARAMASEHVLILDAKRYAFFHEGFFDYAFARRFAARGRDLLSLLRNGEQHLFRRAQVRQILVHEREAEHSRYLADLKSLLTGSDIRFHIKQVVFALLGELPDPTEDEWHMLSSLLDDPADPRTREAWRTLRVSERWFQLLDSLGIITRWLVDSNAERVNGALTVLSSVVRQLPNRVAELLIPT